MNALELELPKGIHSASYLFDGKIRELVASNIANDDYIIRWDTVIDGNRHHILEHIPKDKNGEPLPISEAKRAYALAEFEHIEQGIN